MLLFTIYYGYFFSNSTENTPVDGEDQCLELQSSYKSNELLESLEIWSKLWFSGGLGKKNNIKMCQAKKKGASLYYYFVLHFPISVFVVLLVVGLREREDCCIPAIQITETLLDLSDICHLSHSMLGLNPAAVIYMGSLIKTVRCYLTAYIGNS